MRDFIKSWWATILMAILAVLMLTSNYALWSVVMGSTFSIFFIAMTVLGTTGMVVMVWWVLPECERQNKRLSAMSPSFDDFKSEFHDQIKSVKIDIENTNNVSIVLKYVVALWFLVILYEVNAFTGIISVLQAMGHTVLLALYVVLKYKMKKLHIGELQ